MAKTVEHVHWPDAPDMWMPYAPAIKVQGGTTVYLAGVTAAPVYHHHPHRPEEFDSMPRDMEGQARAALENLKRGLEAVGATFADVVTADRFVTDLSDQDALNRVWGRVFRRRQAGDDDRAGGPARHRSALPGRDQRGRGDRLRAKREDVIGRAGISRGSMPLALSTGMAAGEVMSLIRSRAACWWGECAETAAVNLI